MPKTPPKRRKTTYNATCLRGINPLSELAKRTLQIIAKPFAITPIIANIRDRRVSVGLLKIICKIPASIQIPIKTSKPRK